MWKCVWGVGKYVGVWKRCGGGGNVRGGGGYRDVWEQARVGRRVVSRSGTPTLLTQPPRPQLP